MAMNCVLLGNSRTRLSERKKDLNSLDPHWAFNQPIFSGEGPELWKSMGRYLKFDGNSSALIKFLGDDNTLMPRKDISWGME